MRVCASSKAIEWVLGWLLKMWTHYVYLLHHYMSYPCVRLIAGVPVLAMSKGTGLAGYVFASSVGLELLLSHHMPSCFLTSPPPFWLWAKVNWTSTSRRANVRQDLKFSIHVVPVSTALPSVLQRRNTTHGMSQVRNTMCTVACGYPAIYNLLFLATKTGC